jgi:predicted GNAT family acetyltransferase
LHPFTFGGEDQHYAPGTETVVVDFGGLRCALFVCYDLRFADEFWELAPDVDAYFVVANWPASRREHWRTLLRARAIENQAYVVGVNRVGTGGGLEYSGDTAVIGPFGEELGDAGPDEAVLLADLDAHVVRETRAKYPFLPDRRCHPRARNATCRVSVPLDMGNISLMIVVEDVPERSRFEARRDDVLVGWADYIPTGADLLITHTEVAFNERGHGIGAEMVAKMMEELRARKQPVRAGCSFVAEWIRDNPAPSESLS